MKEIIDDLGIGLFGLFTAIVVALADVMIARTTSFDLFTYMAWFVVPVGAGIVGLAAASGYYFGALYLHKMPRWPLLFQMVLNAAIAQLLIYYVGYATLAIDGIKASELVSFGEYLKILLTTAHYVSRHGVDVGEVGSLGYWIAADQLVGFLIGGVVIFVLLIAKPVCGACRQYLRQLAKNKKFFINGRNAGNFYGQLTSHPLNSPDFATLMRTPTKRLWKRGADGTAIIHTALLECPSCKQQTLDQKVSVCDGNSWKDVDHMKRQVAVPKNVNLLHVFRH